MREFDFYEYACSDNDMVSDYASTFLLGNFNKIKERNIETREKMVVINTLVKDIF